MSKRKLRRLALLVSAVVILLAFAGFVAFEALDSGEDAQEAASSRPVVVADARLDKQPDPDLRPLEAFRPLSPQLTADNLPQDMLRLDSFEPDALAPPSPEALQETPPRLPLLSESAPVADPALAPLPSAPDLLKGPADRNSPPLPPSRPTSLAQQAIALNVPLAPGEESAPLTPTPGPVFKKGAPAFVRIFKQEGTLELWLKQGGQYALYKSFPICKWSGKLGPKTRFGDYQSPEGFYSVSARQLRPNSHYHLAFDVGYPNAYDRRRGHDGSAVMVHGDCKSVGCFAMTNRGIDEIYAYVAAALRAGQREVSVHIFPFRLTDEAIEREAHGGWLAFLSDEQKNDWSGFWRNLKEGYDQFERTREPPVAYACGDRYVFSPGGNACTRIAGW